MVKKFKKLAAKSFVKASVIVAIFALSLVFLPATMRATTCSSTADCDNQINTAKNQAQSLQDEIAGFDSQIQQLTNKIQSTQNDINITNQQIQETQDNIKQAEDELQVKREALGEYLRVIYEESNVTPLEQIASANSFSDFVDTSEYLQTLQAKIKDTVDNIKILEAQLKQKKRDLEDKKGNLDTMMSQLSLQNSALNSQKAAKDALLSQTNDQINTLAAQRAELVKIFNEMMGGGSSGYPYGNPPSQDQVDTPDAYGYLKGECTSYAAWWRAAHGKPVPRNLGNAKDWASIASSDGPRVGDVMVYPHIAPYGHVAIVEAVNSDGTVDTSDYNWNLDWTFHTHSNVNPENWGAVFIH